VCLNKTYVLIKLPILLGFVGNKQFYSQVDIYNLLILSVTMTPFAKIEYGRDVSGGSIATMRQKN